MVFNALLAAVIGLGLLWPEPGLWLAPHRRVLVIAVMLLMSLTLPAERLRGAATNVRGLLSAGLVGYVALPLAGALIGWGAFGDQPGLRAGWVVLGVLPCTLASATVWTRLAKGEDALALTYTIASNLVSVAAIPLLLAWLLGRALPVPAQRVAGDLLVVVLAPVVVGQVLRRLLGQRVDRIRPGVSIVARGLVLAIVLVAVASMSGLLLEDPGAVAPPAVIGTTLHLLAAAAGWWLAARAGLPRGERIAVAFAGSQKTLFVGVFLAQEYFGDEPLALLPITVYHVLQLVIDTVLAGRFARAPEDAPHHPSEQP